MFCFLIFVKGTLSIKLVFTILWRISYLISTLKNSVSGFVTESLTVLNMSNIN